MLGGVVASSTGVGAIGGVPLATIGGVMSGLGMVAGALGYSDGGIATGDEGGHLEKLHGTELIVPMLGGELRKDSKGYADLMKMMGSNNLGSSVIPQPGSMTDSFSRNSYMLDNITAGLEDVGPKVMQAVMNPLGAAMDAISSFMSPKSKDDKMTDVGVNTTDSLSELTGAIGTLIASAEAQLAKQDEMLRAMQDTKDYTERLYNAMA
jgi:cell division protein ZapA (FtsZ GTPase activity inhibitor)